MSVINQMLKDLEKRARSSLNSEMALADIPATVFFPSKKIANKSSLIAVLLFLICGLLLFSYKYLFMYHAIYAERPVYSSTQQNISTAKGDTVMAGNTLHLTPSIVTAITLQSQKDQTSIQLLLSQDLLYQVSMHHNQLVVLLENARLVASLPAINTINSGIQNLKMVNLNNGNIKMVLTLKPGVELTHLELNKANKLPELQLDLLSSVHSETRPAALNMRKAYTQENLGGIIKLRTDLSLGDQYQQALRLSSQGQVNAAIILLSEMLSQDPEYGAARELLASLLINRGQITKAQKLLKVGLQQKPFDPRYMLLKARILVNAGKIKQALELLQLAPPSLSTHPSYYAFIAALHQRQGNSISAEKIYEQLLTLQPNNATWWMGLGIALESMGKGTLALEAYAKARSSESLNPELKLYAATRMSAIGSAGAAGEVI